MKTIAKTLAVTLLFIIVFFGGCYSLKRHIFNRQDCERFNIDNIEVRTGIDVPAVSDYQCTCNENTKTSSFTLKLKEEEEWERYIQRNHFKKIGQTYLNTGSDGYTDWKAELNKQTAQLNFNIKYKK